MAPKGNVRVSIQSTFDDKGAKQAERSFGSLSKSSETLTKHMRGLAAGAAGVAAGYLSIAAAKDAINTTEELAHSTLILHKNFGLSIKSASEWGAVMKARSADGTASGQKLTMSFKQFATQVRNAGQAVQGHGEQLSKLHVKDQQTLDLAAKQGKSLKDLTAMREKMTLAEGRATDGSIKQIKAFEQLGISADTLRKHGNDTNYMLHAVADGLAKLPAGTDKAAIMARLFGRTWQQIAPLIRDGSKALDEQLKTADKYGATLSGKQLKKQEEYIKSQRELKFATLGLKIAFADVAVPALTKFNTLLAKVTRDINGPGSFDEKMKKIAQDVAPAWKEVRDGFNRELPKIANAVGENAPKVAQAFVSGFLKANIWGQLAMGAFLITKVGGWKSIFRKAGTADALAWGKGYTPVAAGEAEAAGVASGKRFSKGFRRFMFYGIAAAITTDLYKQTVGPFNALLDKLGLALNATDPTNGAGQQRADNFAAGLPKSYPVGGYGNKIPGLQKIPKGAKFTPGIAYSGLTMGRTDQGVDFGGKGPVAAVGDGVVTHVGLWNGWPGSGGVVYRLNNGQSVFVMEDFSPSVKVGQRVRANQIIGHATGGSSGIETGWANSAGSAPLVRYNGAADGTPMPGGKDFRQFLATGRTKYGGGSQMLLGTRTGGGGGSGGSGGLTISAQWKTCTLTWYDPALGGVNSGTGAADPNALTASGEPYNPDALTCAAPHHYAFGTLIEFKLGGRTVVCKVNDRGGAITGTHFDLSRAAAEAIGLGGKATAKFRLPGKSVSVRKAKTPFDKLQNRLGYIDLEQQAGVLTPQQAADQERAAINRALPGLHGTQRLQALVTRRGLLPPKKQRKLTPAQMTWTPGNLNNFATAIRNKNPNAFLGPGGTDLIDRSLNNPWLSAAIDKIDRRVAAGDLTEAQGNAEKIKLLQNALPFLPTDAQLDIKGAIRTLQGGGTSSYDQVEGALAHIDAQVRAGDLTTDQGAHAKADILNGTLTDLGNHPGLTADDILNLRGDLNDLNKSLADNTDATEQQVALLQQDNSLKQQQLDLANRALAVAQSEERVLGRALASQVGLILGNRLGMSGATPTRGVAF